MKREAFKLLVFAASAALSLFACAAESSDNTVGDSPIKLILNVDDAAFHPDTAKGIVELWNNHAVSSTSIVAYRSDFDNTSQILKEIDIPVGVHLGLHHGSGVLPASEVPSLHSPEGPFWATTTETMAHMVIAEAEAEFEAQIRRVIDAGLKPVHLDSHMGLLFKSRELLAVYLRLAKKYQLAVALPEGKRFDEARKEMDSVSLKSSISLNGVYEMQDGEEESHANRTEAYRRLLGRLKPGINYCFSHPVPYSESMKNAFGDYKIRNNDYALFMSPQWKEMLREAGVELVSF